MMGDQADTLADIIERLKANRARLNAEGIDRVFVFGSMARNEADAKSDVDLLLEPAPEVCVGGVKLAQWKRLLTEMLGRQADSVVREFLDEKVREAIEHDLVDAFTWQD